jgi:hypothetical protein
MIDALIIDLVTGSSIHWFNVNGTLIEQIGRWGDNGALIQCAIGPSNPQIIDHR